MILRRCTEGPNRGAPAACVAVLLAGLMQPLAVAQVPDDAGLILPPPADGDDLVGAERHVSIDHEDTFADLGRRHGLGYRALRLANPGVDPWLPGAGTEVVLPLRFILPRASREGLVLNTAEMRLYYYPDGPSGRVVTFPVSVGRGDWQTPQGSSRVRRKRRDPVWLPPESIRAEYAADGRPLPERVPAGPDNPLGRYALDLDLPGYLLHGTNRPYGIGMQVTHGCIRLYPRHIEWLYEQVAEGTRVHLVNQPYKVGWHDGMLYLEAHPPLAGDGGGTAGGASANPVDGRSRMVAAVIAATGAHPDYPVDWQRARMIASAPDGRPHPIGRRQRREPTQGFSSGFEAGY